MLVLAVVEEAEDLERMQVTVEMAIADQAAVEVVHQARDSMLAMVEAVATDIAALRHTNESLCGHRRERRQKRGCLGR